MLLCRVLLCPGTLPPAHRWVLLNPQMCCPVSFYHVKVMGKSHWGTGIWPSYWKVLQQGEPNIHNVF